MSMTQEQYYLVKLAEESAELSKIALKTAQFGMHSTNPANGLPNQIAIHNELNDVLASVEDLNQKHGLSFFPNLADQEAKQERTAEYLALSVALDRVEFG